jgi:diketogulonate reductase-like aldo/keto reductase
MMLSHAALLCALATVASAVPVVQLANGVEMPIVSFGTWQYNDSVAEFACTEALSEGFNHFDTALNYNNQAGVGKFLGKALSGTTKRDKIFVTTKVPGCGTFPSVKSGKCGPGTQDAFDQDITLLSSAMSGGEQLFPDLVLVHSPPLGGCTALTCKEIQAQWRVLETMLAQNKTRASKSSFNIASV